MDVIREQLHNNGMLAEGTTLSRLIQTALPQTPAIARPCRHFRSIGCQLSLLRLQCSDVMLVLACNIYSMPQDLPSSRGAKQEGIVESAPVSRVSSSFVDRILENAHQTGGDCPHALFVTPSSNGEVRKRASEPGNGG